uniref:Uncharacterized protein n=1 Tax=Glycine max TaxID=3847 RepID=I1LJD4_SOYBN
MASAVRVALRSFGNRSRSFVKSSTTPFVFTSSSASCISRASSAVANARLTSNIAFDSTCWSSLSRGLKKTL